MFEQFYVRKIVQTFFYLLIENVIEKKLEINGLRMSVVGAGSIPEPV